MPRISKPSLGSTRRDAMVWGSACSLCPGRRPLRASR
jgi:hypothetical protein